MSSDELENTIKNFVDKYNKNIKLQNMLKNWSSKVLIWIRNINKGFVVRIEKGKVVEITKSENFNEGNVKIVGDESILIDMFKGIKNPSSLYLNGVIEVYGPERDQIILDKIVEEIWG
jgi:hypothetical protein